MSALLHSDDTTSGSSVSSSSSMSHIPVPQSKVKRSMQSAVPSTGLPQRIPMTLPRSTAVGSGEVPRRSKASPTLTVPRAPMTNLSNRPASVGRSPSGFPLPKGSTPVGTSKLLVRRRISGGRDANSRLGAASKKRDMPDGGRMDAIESRITSMQDLFDLERKRTEDLLSRERTERQTQEDKVRQLEQDLLEQRRVGGQNGTSGSLWIGEEEIRQIKQRYERENNHLVEQLEREQMTVSSLKVRCGREVTTMIAY
jgi:kinesin family protein C1